LSANTLNRGATYIYDAPLDPVDELLRRAQRYPVLPHERVIELAQRIERGDLDAKDLLINSNLRLVVSVARKYQGQGLSFADLVQEGMLGLIRAAEKFDWRKGYRFSTYATIWIRQALQRGLDNTGRTVRLPAHISQRVRRLGRAERELALRLGREPSLDELATELDTDIDEIERLGSYQQVLASLDAGVGEDGETPLGALLPIDEVPLEEQAILGETSRMVQAGIASLPTEEMQVVGARFGTDGEGEKTVEQTARHLGMSVAETRRIEERALQRLARIPELQRLREAA
jgi:RNA polymerase primary sigma factor